MRSPGFWGDSVDLCKCVALSALTAQLLEPTHFEVYLLVILPFVSALLEGGTPLNQPYRYVSKGTRNIVSILVIFV